MKDSVKMLTILSIISSAALTLAGLAGIPLFGSRSIL